jgi:hypothetical protein
MSNQSTQSPRFNIFRRVWKPTAAIGAGGTAAAVWFEEIKAFSEEILALVFFFIVGGLMYLFNILLCRSQMVRPGDIQKTKDKGVKN